VPGSSSASTARHRDEVADTADLEQHRAVGVALEHRAAQRADHVCAPRPDGRTAPRPIGDIARWHNASAAASAASAGFGSARQPEACLHHLLHLLLVGTTPAGDGVLHLVRRVLDDLAAGERRLGERQPARLPDAHRRAHVDLEEDLLDGDHVGSELGDQVGELGAQRSEALRQRVGAGVRDHPERHRTPLGHRGRRRRRTRSG
jgi:hypothetical protein